MAFNGETFEEFKENWVDTHRSSRCADEPIPGGGGPVTPVNLDRTLRVPVNQTIKMLPPVSERQGKLLGFDVNGDPIAVTGSGGGSDPELEERVEDLEEKYEQVKDGYIGSLKRPPGNTPLIASEGQTTFAVAGGYTGRQGWVTLNGVQVSAPLVNLSSGVNIVFTEPLSQGDEVDYMFFAEFAVSGPATPINNSVTNEKVAENAAINASKLVFIAPGLRAVPVNLADHIAGLGISPRNYGGKGDGIQDDRQAIQDAVLACRLTGKPLDLRGAVGGWRVILGANGVIDLSYIKTILFEYSSPILVDRVADALDKWSVCIGENTGSAFTGRSDGITMLGQFNMASFNQRQVQQNGLLLKGSWFDTGHIHVDNFNGTGMFIDSVWDSTYGRLRSERSGNFTHFALDIASTGDTTNCAHIESLQCESPYDKGMRIDLIRSVITNIHSERLIKTQAGINHLLILGNTQINQAIIDAAPSGTLASDGSTVSTDGHVLISAFLAGSEMSSHAIGGDLQVTGGFDSKISTTACRNLSTSGATGLTLDNVQAENMSLYQGVTAINCKVTNTFNPAFNAANLDVIGGSIANYDATNGILGSIRVRGTTILTLNNTQVPQAGFVNTLFEDCPMGTVNGGFNGSAKIVRGRIQTVSLVSQAAIDFFGVDGDTFGYTGNIAFTTDEHCSFTNVAAWSVPLHRAMRKGARSTNLIYTAGQPLTYINKDAQFTWGPLINAPA